MAPEADKSADRADDYWVSLVDAVQLATREPFGLAAFMMMNLRLPNLEDERKPWEHRGWLLPLVMDMFACEGPRRPLVLGPVRYPGRWGYWYYVRRTGQLPPGDPPPPYVDFGHGSDVARKNVNACAEIIGRRQGFSSAVSLFVDWLAWALAVTDCPAVLDNETQEELYRTFCVDHWRADPADYVGWLMCEYKGRAFDPTGFFPTPQNVVTCMSQMMMESAEPGPETVFLKICDPCVGSGRMLLAASNYSLCLFGQDINPRCVLATLINGAVYAPWIAFPFRGVVRGRPERGRPSGRR